MVMSVVGTFEYEFVVPAGEPSARRRMPGALRATLGTGEQGRLVGDVPLLETVECQREAWQLYARVTLHATHRTSATVASASFLVDRELISALRGGDRLHVSRTDVAGLGLSILRDGRLVAAAGDLTSVPLGPDVRARMPLDLVHAAEAIMHRRDPEYRMHDMPLELTVHGETRVLHSGRPKMGPYDVFVIHGFLPGMPGTASCASIERRGVCPDTAAHTTAQLLETERFEMTGWGEPA